jgi:zinc transport system substrate-binding protein
MFIRRSSIFIIIVLVLLIVSVASFAYFKPNFFKTQTSSNKLKISTSFHPLQQITKEIAGQKADVFRVTPVGQEAHDFTPSTQDRINIQESNLFVYQGGDFDNWAQKISEDKNIKSVEFSSGFSFSVNNEEKDPHIWLNPLIVKDQSKNILQKLKEIDSKNSKYYEDNYNNFVQNLQNLDSDYKTKLSNCKQNSVVVSHDAYGYLAQAYKFETKPIQDLSTLDVVTTTQIAEIIDFIKTQNIKYIMVEEVVSNNIVEQIKAQTGVQFLELSPLESVDEETQNQTYFEGMQKNLKNLTIALECPV